MFIDQETLCTRLKTALTVSIVVGTIAIPTTYFVAHHQGTKEGKQQKAEEVSSVLYNDAWDARQFAKYARSASAQDSLLNWEYALDTAAECLDFHGIIHKQHSKSFSSWSEMSSALYSKEE